MPFKDNYAYFENGVDRINENVAAPGTNKVETAYELIRVINRAAGGHVVASFGEWDINNQSDTGILIPADKTELDAPFDGQLQGKPLKSEEGYQIYIREVEGIDTERIAFKIKSQP